MDWLSVIVLSFLSAFAFLNIVFVIGAVKDRFDIIDSAWGPTFIVIAAANLWTADHVYWWKLLVFAMVVLWGCRLAWHIGRRFVKSQEEDRRYTELRSKWPQKLLGLQTYLRIYVAQALLACVVSVPVMLVMHATSYKPALVIVGLLLWLIGFAFEAVGDQQLKDFIADATNKGKLMTAGLWRYSRHPNYFGELTQWWALGIIGLMASYGVVGLIGPAALSLLILAVSGVPPAERSSSKRPGWESYKRRTSVLIPLPPRKRRGASSTQ
jgi:steroid 5-alpha reductase family enzyme